MIDKLVADRFVKHYGFPVKQENVQDLRAAVGISPVEGDHAERRNKIVMNGFRSILGA